MSHEISVSVGKPFGLQRVCQVLDFPRSTIYAVRARASAGVTPMVVRRRGPKPKMPDADLLKAIRDDLAASPFKGEGHRKVSARLRILHDIRVSRTRVLRLMREHSLLSPHRQARGEPNLHDGWITTDRPNKMWGTDGVRIATVDDGMVWIFCAVDHCDGMCTGIHAAKIGDRFAALEPISQGLLGEFGSVGADAGRGLSLRMDHGSQYTSDDFRDQIRFWGVAPSYAFVAEPQTNGVAERFNRTMKEQAIHGRIFENLEEVRAAAVAFKDRYNRDWRLEKLGFKSPLEARQENLIKLAA
ncbi:integrase core domain-containing protein [Caballeronia sordidicola]|uniref:Mobile element protein n=1 Tax=Caballeronia sordidicola TaxID=196367 RepID=A0A242M5F4_CABSO|nr:integrase core domain-containing protein [Caballeronia sordidicola]OTP66426.1 Mobile element protein [Caballeronia sordidicola]